LKNPPISPYSPDDFPQSDPLETGYEHDQCHANACR
jgi:hypothetical protein